MEERRNGPFVICREVSGRLEVFKCLTTAPQWSHLHKLTKHDKGTRAGIVLFTHLEDARERLTHLKGHEPEIGRLRDIDRVKNANRTLIKKKNVVFSVMTFAEAYQLLVEQSQDNPEVAAGK